MEVKDHLSFERLKRLEREEKRAGHARRLRIVLLAIQGWTAPAIGMAVGLSRRVCQQWVYRFNEHGLDGLQDDRGLARISHHMLESWGFGGVRRAFGQDGGETAFSCG